MAHLQLFPYVLTPEGTWSIPDATMAAIWMQLEQEDKVRHLFYDGSIRDLTSWLAFIKRSGVHLAVVVNMAEPAHPVHLAWLSDVHDNKAWVHHCALGKYTRGSWECLRDYWAKAEFIQVLLGTTPVTNQKAWKLTERICKWTKVGIIPDICYLAYEDRRVPGIVSYYHLHPSEEYKQWVESQVPKVAAVA